MRWLVHRMRPARLRHGHHGSTMWTRASIVGRDVNAVGGKQDNVAEAAAQMVVHGRADLDLVLGQHDGTAGPLPRSARCAVEKGVKDGITHWGSGRGWPQIRRSGGPMQGRSWKVRGRAVARRGRDCGLEAVRPGDRPMTEVKKLFVKTYGCQMNVYDSERMAEALGAKGYVTTDVVEDADMVLLEHLPHPRKGVGEAVFRPWPAARAEGGKAGAEGRRCGLRGAGRGRRDPAPVAGGRSGGRPASLSPAARDGGGRGAADRHRVPGRGQVHPAARTQGHCAGRRRF